MRHWCVTCLYSNTDLTIRPGLNSSESSQPTSGRYLSVLISTRIYVGKHLPPPSTMAGPEKDGGTIHPPKPPLITPKTTTVSKATFPMSLETRLITNCPISTPDKPSTRYYVATSIKPQKTVPTQPPHHDTTLCNTKNLPAPQHKNQSQKDEKNVLCYTDTPPPTTTTCLPSCPHLVNLSVNGKHNDRTQRTNTPAPRQYRLPKMGTKLNHIPPNTRKSTQLPSNFTPITNINPTAQKKMQIGTRLHDVPTICCYTFNV